MNSAHMGAAEWAPSRSRSRLSSKPTQTMQSSSEVYPANQPSCEVPVLPAAGAFELYSRGCRPRCRCGALLPSCWSSGRLRAGRAPASFRAILVDCLAVLRAHQRNEVGLHILAAVGENGVRAGGFQRRNVIRPQRHGGRRHDFVVHAGALRHGDHVVIAHHLAPLRPRPSSGVRQRRPNA